MNQNKSSRKSIQIKSEGLMHKQQEFLNNRAVFSSLIIQIIGGVIIVVLLMTLFSGFSGPFLEFLADSENIKSFNKITSGLADSCRNTISTKTYFGFTSAGLKKNYVVAVVGPETHKALEDLSNVPAENHDNSNKPYTDKYAYTSTEKCVGGDYCVCLLKLYYNDQNNNQPYCPGFDATAIVVPESGRTHYYTDGKIGYKIYSTYKAAQGFKPEADKTIDTVYIKGGYLTSEYMQPVSVLIYNKSSSSNNPGSSVVATSTLKADSFNSQVQWLEFKLDSPVTLAKDKVYYIVVNASTALSSHPFFWFGTTEGFEYADLKDERKLEPTDFGQISTWTVTPNPDIKIFDFSIPEQKNGSEAAYAQWDQELAEALFQRYDKTNNYPFQYVRFIQCRSLKGDIGCENEYEKIVSPMITVEDENYYITWIQPRISGKEVTLETQEGVSQTFGYSVPRSLWFDSLTIKQPIMDSMLQNYTLVYSEPPLIAKIHAIGEAPIVGQCISEIGNLG